MSYKEEINKMEKLEIGDVLYPNDNIKIARVVGGWIWTEFFEYHHINTATNTFIPISPKE
jgi:hypothetical protein